MSCAAATLLIQHNNPILGCCGAGVFIYPKPNHNINNLSVSYIKQTYLTKGPRRNAQKIVAFIRVSEFLSITGSGEPSIILKYLSTGKYKFIICPLDFGLYFGSIYWFEVITCYIYCN